MTPISWRSARLSSVLALACSLLLLGCSGNGGGTGNDGGTDAVAVPFSSQEAIEACIRLNACGVQRTARLGDCINDFHKRYILFGQRRLYENAYRCANQAGADCTKIRPCAGYAARSAPCDATYVARCDGEVARNCDLIARAEQAIDCAKGGLKCGVSTNSSGKAAICGGGACDPAKSKAECRDSKRFECVGGAIQISDCPEAGLQCRDGKSAVCEGTGVSCQEFASECQGSTVVKCTEGYVSKTDCSKVFGHKTCARESALCVPSGKECSVDSDFDNCDGDNLVVCIDGYRKRIDCRKMGFDGCVKGGVYGASCRPPPVHAE
ncbi:MAG: hypothetical protein IT371_17925 [Deltaproteobacteria bacterium]|nr:hypothetical protein [Deltaproteobacteria bacterium]